MKVLDTGINGLKIIEPVIFSDNRGYFFEPFNFNNFKKWFHGVEFIQDNESRSTYGVLRGLHFQKPPYEQSKLVRVIEGKVLDVVVDLRKNSPTYGKHFSLIIDSKNNSGWIHWSQLKKINSIILLEDKILFKNSSNFSKPLAKIKEGRLLIVQKCEGEWCKVKTKKIKGWIKVDNVWGLIN